MARSKSAWGRSVYKRIGKAWQQGGASLIAARALRWARGGWRRFGRRSDQDGAAFDAAYGVKTCGDVRLSSLDIENPVWTQGEAYEPSCPIRVRQLLRYMDIAHSEYTFIDFGCGKGRVLLLASELPFRRVVGVDLAPELCDIARANVEAFRPYARCRQLDVVCDDALAFALPPVPSVYYLYNPFGRPLVTKLAERVERSLRQTPRDVIVVYETPLYDDVWVMPSLAPGPRIAGTATYRSRAT
jgi:SAM-dependent methyltransferase